MRQTRFEGGRRIASGAYSRGRLALASRLARSTIFYSLNFSVQIFLQFGYFLLLVRTFDAQGYGVLVSVTAIILFLSNFVGWGCERILIQRVAVNHDDFRDYLGHSLISILLTAPIVFLVGFYAVSAVAGGHLSSLAIAAFVLSDALFLKITFLCGSCYMAHDQTVRHVLLSLGVTAVKIATLIAVQSFTETISLNEFALWYLAANILCAAFALGLVCYELNAPRLRFFLSEWRLGLLYSLEYATLSGMKDLDKPIVLAALGAEASGHYAAAYRVVEAASAPIMGLLYATYTGYFKSAHSHWSEGIRFGMRVLPYGVALSVGASIFLLGISEYLPMILGADFEKSVLLVQLLCLHPILRIVASIGSDILRAINLQGLRVTIMIVSTAAVLPAAWIGIELGALSGAAIAGQIVSLLGALCVWAFILRKSSNREDASGAHA